MKITSKSQMYEMLQNGEFGNSIQTWKSPEEALASGYRGNVMIRPMSPGGISIPHVPIDDVLRFARVHYPRGGYCLNAMQPDNKIVLQGEICESPVLHLFYSRAKFPMRIALSIAARIAEGLSARLILREVMDQASYETIFELLDLYSDCTIEFSTYSCSVGRVPNRNTLIWEVRHY